MEIHPFGHIIHHTDYLMHIHNIFYITLHSEELHNILGIT
nr:MAG TPA: hypothetical protein [Caudoviricetes sp.]